MSDAAATAGEAATLVRLSGFIWRRLPPRVGKVSVTLGSLLADGAYLSSWPFAGALLPPTALLAAFWFAWRHVGFDSNDQVIFLYQWAPLIFMIMGMALALISRIRQLGVEGAHPVQAASHPGTPRSLRSPANQPLTP